VADVSEICVDPLVSEFLVSLSLSVQPRGITLEITGACQGPVAQRQTGSVIRFTSALLPVASFQRRNRSPRSGPCCLRPAIDLSGFKRALWLHGGRRWPRCQFLEEYQVASISRWRRLLGLGARLPGEKPARRKRRRTRSARVTIAKGFERSRAVKDTSSLCCLWRGRYLPIPLLPRALRKSLWSWIAPVTLGSEGALPPSRLTK
jgi:hypothetical protein